MKIRLFIIVLLLLVCSCEKDSDNSYKLDINKLKSTWIFQKYIDKETNEFYFLPEGYCAELTFHGEDCICVIGPCNSGPAKYTISGNKILITNIAMTERGCIIDEKRFTNNLSGQYTIKGDTLNIQSDFDTDLQFIMADSTKVYECYDF